MIASTGGGGATTSLSSVGTGTNLVQDGVGPDLSILTLGINPISIDLAIISRGADGVLINLVRNAITSVVSGVSPVPPQRATLVAGDNQLGPDFTLKSIASGSGTGAGGAPGTGLLNAGMTIVDTSTDVLLYTHAYIRNGIITTSTGTLPRSFYAGYNSIYKKNGVTTGEVSTISYVTNTLDATITLATPNIPYYLFHFIQNFEFEIYNGPTFTLNISMPNVWAQASDVGAVTFDFVRRNTSTHVNVSGQPPMPYGAAGTPTVTYTGFDVPSLTATWTISNPTNDLLVRVGLV